MQTNPAVEQNKSIKWSASLWNQSDESLGEEKIYGRKEPTLKYRMKDCTS